MEIIEPIIIISILILVICIIYYLAFYFFKFILLKFNQSIKPILLARMLGFISVVLFLFYVFLIYSSSYQPARPLSGNDLPETKIHGIGKILIDSPDSMRLFHNYRIIVRIAKKNLKDSIFFTTNDYHFANISNHEIYQTDDDFYNRSKIIDTLKISSVMTVDLKAIDEKSAEIRQLNINKSQVLDTSKYSQWLFMVKPIEKGEINFVVSVSALVFTDFGIQNLDYSPLYEKRIRIVSMGLDSVKLIWRDYYWLIYIVLVYIFLIILKLIPKQTIIEYMENSKNTNFWNAGSLGIVIYLITIISFVVFALFDISLFFVPLVFVGAILIYAVFTAVSLRDNDKLSEENFLNLMGIAIKKIPPLSWLGGKSDSKKGQL